MGKFHFSSRYLVGLLCAATLIISPVASAGTVSVDVSPTTGYSVTNRSTVALPPRTTTGPVQTYNPTLGPLAGGGAYQSTSSGITITAIKEGGASSTTMSGRINATAGAMRNGLARCLTSFRCNIALMGGAAGIEALFNGIDWIMEEGGQISRITPPPAESSAPSCPPGRQCIVATYGAGGCLPATADKPYCYNSADMRNACNATDRASCYDYKNANGTYSIIPSYASRTMSPPYWPLASVFVDTDRYTKGFYINHALPPIIGPKEPVPPSEIPPAVDSYYNPQPSDLPFLSTGGLDFGHAGVDFEIVDIPSITGAGSPNFIENSDGTSKGTYSEYEFTWSGPSKQPKVDVQEKTTETTYSPTGEPTGTTTTIVGGGGSSANVPIEIPTDCAFMPTVCRFIDWFTEPDPEINQDVDFTQLIDVVEVDREFSVGASTAACPAPFVVNLSWVPSVEVSLQPFCDLADLLRPVLLAIASLYSGMIVLRT